MGLPTLTLLILAVLGLLPAAGAVAPSPEGAARKLLQSPVTNGVLDLSSVTLDGTNGVTLYGRDGYDRMGNSVCVGDVNGDGFADIVVAAYFGDGTGDNAVNTGEVYLLFGHDGAWASDFDLNTITLDGTNGVVIYGENAGDKLGLTVVTGDLNGDGYADVVMRAYLPTSASQDDGSNELYVLFGKPGPWPAAIDLATYTLDGTNGFVVLGKDAWDQAGFSICAGDLNGDGMSDLVMGAVGGDGSANDATSAGEVFVVFGQHTWPASVNLGTLQLSGINGFSVYGKDPYDSAGYSVTVGDVNGDGRDDLMLGAKGGDGISNTASGAGEVYVFFGLDAGWPASYDLKTHVFTGEKGFVVYGRDPSDMLGRSVSVGDINGDGHADLLIGSNGGDTNLGDNLIGRGEVFCLFGRTTWQGHYDLSTTALDGINGFVVVGRSIWEKVGFSVKAGDINGDGFADLIMGSTGADSITDEVVTSQKGEVVILYGHSDNTAWSAEYNLATYSFDGTNGILIKGRGIYDRAGFSVAVADLNGNGFTDLILGAFKADGTAEIGSTWDTGEIYLMFGVSAPLKCQPGQYDTNHVSGGAVNCQTCPVGSTCTGIGPAIPCPAHFTSPAGSTSHAACACMSGYYPQGTTCIKCNKCKSDSYQIATCSGGSSEPVCQKCTGPDWDVQLVLQGSGLGSLPTSTPQYAFPGGGVVRACKPPAIL